LIIKVYFINFKDSFNFIKNNRKLYLIENTLKLLKVKNRIIIESKIRVF